MKKSIIQVFLLCCSKFGVCVISSTQAQFRLQSFNDVIFLRGGFSSSIRGGFSSSTLAASNNDITDSPLIDVDILIVEGCSLNSTTDLNGVYSRSSQDINGRSHFERISSNITESSVHLYWSKNQWMFHFDTDPSLNYDNLLAYAKFPASLPLEAGSLWHIRRGNAFVISPELTVSLPGQRVVSRTDAVQGEAPTAEVMGVPKALWPIFAAFMLDAIAVGLVMPLLPFYVMQLNANALQLSMVVSANYIAQMIGCVFMGRVSDLHGRRVVAAFCLSASALSYFCVSHAKTLVGVALARIIAGSCGGLVPIIQSTVSDVIPLAERPKYLGRVQAAFGLGFVLGPMLSALLPMLSPAHKIRLGSLLPFGGLLLCLAFLQETKAGLRLTPSSPATTTSTTSDGKESVSSDQSASTPPQPRPQVLTVQKTGAVSLPVAALVFNGFLLMYAFGTETIYAMFLKDVFGYGERTLSTVLAVNGLLIGVFQIFLIKYIVQRFGKHFTLSLGNAMLSVGMLGVGLCRNKALHFAAFTVHIIGYSIADTGVASLITRYGSASSQGRDLALNQAAQACARVVSPMVAGLLYQRSLRGKTFPIGSLPYIVGALFPAIGVAVPFFLKWLKKRMRNKKDLTD